MKRIVILDPISDDAARRLQEETGWAVEKRLGLSPAELPAAVEAAVMLGHDRAAVHDSHCVEARHHHHGLTDQFVRHRVVVVVEADVRRLAHHKFAPLVGGERRLR